MPAEDPNSRLRLTGADITTLDVDAIVNAANRRLAGGGGVDGAIHRAAGPGLLEECLALGGCETGDAKVTDGHRLPARHVIHAVGPVWRDGKRGEDALLASCYRRSLELAFENDIRTMAFPAISCGAYRFPIARAARIAVGAVREMIAGDERIECVWFCCFGEDVRKAYEQLLQGQVSARRDNS
ncbi:O-acetyl-ADP-ribose deacetylase [soil metagenome]